MIQYSINELESLTGIRAHTIRIWEKRYGLLKPERTDTNIRLYSNDELRRLINVSSLYNAGMKISHIVNLSENEIKAKINLMTSSSYDEGIAVYETYIGNLIQASLNFDEAGFEKNFSNAILRYGLLNTYRFILMPMLQRIGILWNTNDMNPAQEHFITNLILQKLYSAIDGMAPVADSKEKWVLFLPQLEYHEISLLIANYILRNEGRKVFYIGGRVPHGALLQTVQSTNPTHLLLSVLRHQPVEELQDYIDKLDRDFGHLRILIIGNFSLLSQINFKKSITWVKSFDDFFKHFMQKSVL